MTGASSGSICWCRSPSKRLTPRQNATPQVIGIDVGQRYLATVATLDNGAQFYSRKGDTRQGGPLRPPAKTTSAKRHSQRHTATHRPRPARETVEAEYQPHDSKHILDTHPHAFIGLEDLTGIRERTKRETRQEGDASGSAAANRHASKWAFAELHGLLAYKATLAGVAVHQGGRRLHQPGLPALRLYQPREPAPEGVALCLPAVSVTPSMPIWWVPGISACERLSSGRTGWQRGSCQMPLM